MTTGAMIGGVLKTTKTRLKCLAISALALLLLATLTACDKRIEKEPLNLTHWLGGKADNGFAQAITPRTFQFPEDHNAHPEFRNEWWYVTGNVQDSAGHEFGYQVTFFRIALTPEVTLKNEVKTKTSHWATNQMWMAHVALSDINDKQHYHDQRLARGTLGLAGVELTPSFKVWLEDWQILGVNKGEFPWKIEVETDKFALNLSIKPSKPVVLQGNQGLSIKGAGTGNASYYYSHTRLQTSGSLSRKGKRFQVSGNSWLDREWSTSVLGEDQAGWDWFSLQLDEGEEVMYYQLRKKSGEIDPASAGKWVNTITETNAKDSNHYQTLSFQDVILKPIAHWTSNTGRRYPITWEMTIPSCHKKWKIQARFADQEMKTGIQYWEGAVAVIDSETGRAVGKGYLEMTGY